MTTFEEQFPRLNFYPAGKHLIRRIKGESLSHAKIHNSDSEIIDVCNSSGMSEISNEDVVFIPKDDLVKHCLDKQKVREAILEYIERVDRKVMLDSRFQRCNCCGYDLNDQNNRDKLFSKTVLQELLKELNL